MLGNMSNEARTCFFQHLKSLRPWMGVPLLNEDGVDLSRIIPVTIHGGGAQFYRDDDIFVWSWSSAFGFKSNIKDPLLLKFPICIIPERCMRSHNVTSNEVSTRFCFVSSMVCNFGNSKPSGKRSGLYPMKAHSRLEVRSAVNKVVAEPTAWSIKLASAGVFPAEGFYGECFEAGTFRSKLQGQQMAHGWKFLVKFMAGFIFPFSVPS